MWHFEIDGPPWAGLALLAIGFVFGLWVGSMVGATAL